MSSENSSFTLSLEGSLTTSRSDSIRTAVLQALRDHSSVSIDCAGADEIDVTFLQILIGASRTASSWNKTIQLAEPPSGPLAAAMGRCGFATNTQATTSLADIFSPTSQAQS